MALDSFYHEELLMLFSATAVTFDRVGEWWSSGGVWDKGRYPTGVTCMVWDGRMLLACFDVHVY